MNLTLPLNLFCLFVIQLCHCGPSEVCAMICPETVYIEIGKDGNINCKLTDNGDVYWYRGNSTKTSPIVRLEDGQKEILQESSSYDIDSGGSLIIRNMQDQYVDVYSVVNFYGNGKPETYQIKVQIAVKPQTTCPVIAGCNDCNHCVLNKTEMGNISCSISGIRPQLHLNIVTDSKNRINVIRNVSSATYDAKSELWNETTSIEYSEWSDCISPLQIWCITGNEHPFDLSYSVAHLKPVVCSITRETPLHEEPGELHIPIVVIIALAVASGVVFLAVIGFGLVFGTKRAFQKQSLNASEEDCQMALVEDGSNVKGYRELIAHLKELYETHQPSELKLNGEKISTNVLFKEMRFSLTEKDTDSSSIISSEDLVMQLFQRESTFVLITDNDFERESFFKYVCSRLLDENLAQEIIFAFHCEGLHSDTSITDAIVWKLGLSGKVTTADLEKVLENKRCLIVLEGIDELTINTNKSKNTKALSQVFKGSNSFENFRDLRCLVLSNSESNWTNVIPQSSCVIKFHLPFPDSVPQLVSHILEFYGGNDGSSNRPIAANYEDENNKLSEEHTSPDENISQRENILSQQFTKGTDFLGEFDLSPLFTVLCYHAMISAIARKAVTVPDFYFCRRSYLARIILSCLNFLYSNIIKGESGFHILLTELGKICFTREPEETQHKKEWKLKCEFKEDELKKIIGKSEFEAVLKIGLLKHQNLCGAMGKHDSNDECNNVSNHMIGFCHEYIQDIIVAKLISTDKDKLEQFLSSSCWCKDRQMMQVLHMIYGMEATGTQRTKLLKTLVKASEWDILIDCLFESEVTKEVSFKMLNIFPASLFESGYTVKITHLDEPYHMMAVFRFFKNLASYKISLRSLHLKGDSDLEFLCDLEIPQLESLVLEEMNLSDEEDVLLILKTALFKNLATNFIRFINCDLPPQLSTKGTEIISPLVSAFEAARIPVYRTNRVNDESTSSPDASTRHQLNFKTGMWEKVTPKHFLGVSISTPME